MRGWEGEREGGWEGEREGGREGEREGERVKKTISCQLTAFLEVAFSFPLDCFFS